MENVIGKIKQLIVLFFLLMSCGVCASSEIILTVLDMNYKPIKQAMCQAPFILQVELRNADSYIQKHLMQHLSGIENFKVSRSMSSENVSIDNGKKTVKRFYQFVLRGDKKGNFTIGPVHFKDSSGNFVRSNRLIIPVGDELVAAESTGKEKYFITMTINKKTAYVGEKLTLSIKFHDRLFVDDLHLQFPEFENLHIVNNKNNVRKKTVEIDEEEYAQTEWIFDIYPTQPGTLLIQDIRAAFFAPEFESKFTFGGGFDFFRSLTKSQQHLVAQPIQLQILPLPPHKDFHDVVAVGQFSKYSISMNQTTAQAGEGIIVTTELCGNANFEMMPSVQLQLPEGFKYYDANMATIDQQRNYKRAEFIVQAEQPGTYHIDRQSLVYFDPIETRYKIIESNSLQDITITSLDQEQQKWQNNHEPDDQHEKQVQTTPAILQDFTVLEKGACVYQPTCMIPYSIFNYLLWLLFFIWFLLALDRYIFQRYLYTHPTWKKYRIFFQAKYTYRRAINEQKVYALYPLFMHIFEQLLDVKAGQLQQDAILYYLISKKFTDEDIHDWNRFYQQILHASFSLQAGMQEYDSHAHLFKQALHWIHLLKDKA